MPDQFTDDNLLSTPAENDELIAKIREDNPGIALNLSIAPLPTPLTTKDTGGQLVHMVNNYPVAQIYWQWKQIQGPSKIIIADNGMPKPISTTPPVEPVEQEPPSTSTGIGAGQTAFGTPLAIVPGSKDDLIVQAIALLNQALNGK